MQAHAAPDASPKRLRLVAPRPLARATGARRLREAVPCAQAPQCVWLRRCAAAHIWGERAAPACCRRTTLPAMHCIRVTLNLRPRPASAAAQPAGVPRLCARRCGRSAWECRVSCGHVMRGPAAGARSRGFELVGALGGRPPSCCSGQQGKGSQRAALGGGSREASRNLCWGQGGPGRGLRTGSKDGCGWGGGGGSVVYTRAGDRGALAGSAQAGEARCQRGHLLAGARVGPRGCVWGEARGVE